ncbi:transaldolase family protein [Shouchella sp. JSM 1781072]|uniref:transaldolase family protein n=1 Tax=Shouchella sp. JSM 1781072 TaxID=3344581 RepID=UPI0035BF2485
MFLDTANYEEIEAALALGIFDGVTTNPTILLKEYRSRFDMMTLASQMGIPFLFVQVVGNRMEDMWEDYLLLLEQSDHMHGTSIGVKVPLHHEGIRFIKKVKQSDPQFPVLGTAIYTAEQAIIGSLAGCHYLSPYVNRMASNSLNPYVEIKRMRQFIDNQGLDVQILAASFHESQEVVQALEAGAHSATISYQMYQDLINNKLALLDIHTFNDHARQLPTGENV